MKKSKDPPISRGLFDTNPTNGNLFYPGTTTTNPRHKCPCRRWAFFSHSLGGEIWTEITWEKFLRPLQCGLWRPGGPGQGLRAMTAIDLAFLRACRTGVLSSLTVDGTGSAARETLIGHVVKQPAATLPTYVASATNYVWPADAGRSRLRRGQWQEHGRGRRQSNRSSTGASMHY